jgi:hypothetical protein
MPIDMNADEFVAEQIYKSSVWGGEDLLNENPKLKAYTGKYERYYFDGDRKQLVIKEIITIHSDASVIVRSTRGILKGIAIYFMNSTLSIVITSLNEEPYNEHLIGYVGRYDYANIENISIICSTINIKNIPIARNELLIPSSQATNFPELIETNSQAFYKLNYKYPNLLKGLQTRTIKGASEVTWE